MKTFIKLSLVVLASLLFVGDIQAQQSSSSLVLTDEQELYSVAEYAEIYVDEGGELTIEQISTDDFKGEFKPASEVGTSGDSAYWFRLNVDNQSIPSTAWLITYDEYRLNEISVYTSDPHGTGFREVHTGNTFPFSSREIEYHYYVFNLYARSGSDNTIYLRLFDVNGASKGGLTIQSLKYFAENAAREQFRAGVYYAVILTVLVYNLFFVFSLRDESVKYFALFLASVLLVSLSTDGLGHQYIWPNCTLWAEMSTVSSVSLYLATLLSFTLEVLGIAVYFPGWFRTAKMVIVGLLILIPIRWIPNLDQDIYLPIFLLFLFSGFILPILLAFRMFSVHRRQAFVFLLAFAAYLVVIILNTIDSLQRLDIINFSSLTRWAFIWILFVFSIVINNRIREIRRQREQAQENLLVEQQESLRIKTEFIQELEDKNAELERFTYTVSHDLKSPLVTIGGFLGSLEQDAATGNTERLKDDIQRIQKAVNRMQRLLSELLELSRIGHLMNPPEPVPFESLAREALVLVHGQLELRGVTFSLGPDLPVVYGDRLRLVEVLQNLIDNAVKFMGDQPNPHIQIGQQGEEDGKPVLYVKDNGIGVSPEYHERIFGLFDKLDAKTDGTGIGLALVKRIVEFHGGRIWVESEADKGSIFYFSLPLRPAE